MEPGYLSRLNVKNVAFWQLIVTVVFLLTVNLLAVYQSSTHAVFLLPAPWRANKRDPGNEISVYSRTLLFIKVNERTTNWTNEFTHGLCSWQFSWLLGVFGENERKPREWPWWNFSNQTPGGFAACSGALLQLKPVYSVWVKGVLFQPFFFLKKSSFSFGPSFVHRAEFNRVRTWIFVENETTEESCHFP